MPYFLVTKMTIEIPESEKVRLGQKCSLCDAEIEIFETDNETIYLSCPNSDGDDGHDEYKFTVLQIIRWGWVVDFEDIIRSAITDTVTANYLLADYGEKITVYRNGSVHIGQSVDNEISKEGRPIAVVSCPGFSNLDKTLFADVSMEITRMDECVCEAVQADPDFKEELIENLIRGCPK